MRKLLLLLVCMVMAKLHAQTLITITATGSPGSYATGSVNSAGTKNDDLMTGINSSSNRGWAVFDLSAIPSGSTINTVTLKFTTTSASVNSTATNYIGGYAWSAATDPATLAGATLYTDLLANSSSNFNASSWTVNALQTKTLNASGIALVSGNLGGKVVISFVRGSTNSYVINGYGSSAPPVLEIDYLSSVPCSGTPTAGVASGPSSGAVCPNTTFSLASNAVNGVGGIAYDWQANTGSGWVSTGGTTVNYTVASGITVPTDYRLVATCTNTNDRDTSNTVSLTVNPFYNCYCTPASTCTNEGIVNVTMSTLNNTSPMCAGGYSDFKGLGSQATVTQGQQVAISVTDSINSNPSSAGVWIDYDHSGTFDASEFTLVGSTTTFTGTKMPFTFTNNINIPSGALTGVTAMRVRGANSSTPVAASGNYGPCNGTTVYGEYEDYLITINAGTPCSGTPSAGTLSSTVTSVACSKQFIVSAAGYTSGVTGLTFQWEESTDGINFTPQGTSSFDYKDDTVATISQTMYYRLAVTCGAGTPSYSDTMTVTFGALAAPFIESFNGSTTPSCWTQIASSAGGNWQYGTSLNNSYGITSAADHTGNGGRYAWVDGSSPITTGQITMLVSPVIDISTLTTPQVRYYIISYINSTYLPNLNKLAVDAYDFNINDWVPVDSVQQNFSSEAWQERNASLAAVTSTTTQLRFRFEGTATTTFYNDILIDDVNVEEMPSCPTPTMGTASNVTTSTADVDWIENGTASQWEIEYGQNNFVLGTGTRVIATTNPYSITVSPSTTYTYFVRSICGPNDTSAWSGRSSSFLTPCLPVSTLPWTENFDALSSTGTTSFPPCWFKENGDWSTSAATAYNTSFSTPNHLRCAWAATNEYMWTPGFDLVANTSYDLSFYVAGDGWTGWTVDVFENTAQISAGANQIGTTFTAPGSGSIAIQPYTKQTYTFMPSSTGTYYFAVRVNQPSGSPWYIAFDNFTLEVTPACPAPQSLVANNVTSNSADLQWTEVGTATQWEIEYAPSGNFTLGSGTRAYTTTNPHALAGLASSTTYSYFVRSICGPNDTSSWSARYTFLTACAPVTTLPWTENFDALASTGTTSYPPCWFKENGDWSTSAATAYNTSFSTPNHLRCAWAATNEYMWTPGFDLVANTSYDLSFQVAGDGWTGWTVDVFENTTQISTGANQIGTTFTAPGSGSIAIQPYTKQTYTFVPSSTGTYYFAVRVNQPSGTPWYIAFDDFTVELTPSCPAPQSLSTANVAANTADLQWTEVGGATQWEVEYGPSPLTLGSGTRTITTSNPHSISGLNQATAHQFYVRSICGPGDTSSWSGPNSFTTTVSCPAPTAISISNITANSVDVNWTSTGGTEILEYGPTGHVPGTGATAGTGGTIITGVTPPYTISGLSASSGYDVFIRQDCSAASNGFSLNLSAPIATTGAPANDTICGAYTLTVGSTTPVWVNTTNATVTASDPQDFVGCTGANNNVWYQFTTTTAGVYDITGYSSQVTTTNALQNMSAWAWLYSATGACPALTLTLVGDLTACNANLALPATNNAAPNVMRTISTPSLAAATTYYLFLDGNSGSYGNIGITVANPLAIRLDKISAVNNGNANRVDWNTLSEERGDRFELERSVDGKNFIRIYEQRANGEASRYTYMDNNAVKGMNHYRLRMVAANGSVTYSETVSAFVRSAGFEVEAFPNPVSHELTVKVSGVQGADATIQVTDVTGKVIKTVKMNGNVQAINMSGLANGIYLIKYADVNHTQTIKVNKQ